VYLNNLQLTSVSLCELSINQLWSWTWSKGGMLGGANNLSADRRKVHHVSIFNLLAESSFYSSCAAFFIVVLPLSHWPTCVWTLILVELGEGCEILVAPPIFLHCFVSCTRAAIRRHNLHYLFLCLFYPTPPSCSPPSPDATGCHRMSAAFGEENLMRRFACE